MAVTGSGVPVDQDDRIAAIFTNQSGRGIHDQTGPADDEQIRFTNGVDRIHQDIAVETFFIQDDIGFDDAAALRAVRNRRTKCDKVVNAEKGPALGTIVAMDGAVQLIHGFAAGPLVQAVDILRDDGAEAAALFQSGQGIVGAVGSDVAHHAFTLFVIIEKFFRMFEVKMVREHFFRRPGRIGGAAVETVRAAKVGDVGFGGYARTSEKDDTGMCP